MWHKHGDQYVAELQKKITKNYQADFGIAENAQHY